MKSENAIERRARVRSARLLERPLNLRATIAGLKYIGDVDQPEHNHGGFHDYAILMARSALRQIERLRSRSNNILYVKNGNQKYETKTQASP